MYWDGGFFVDWDSCPMHIGVTYAGVAAYASVQHGAAFLDSAPDALRRYLFYGIRLWDSADVQKKTL